MKARTVRARTFLTPLKSVIKTLKIDVFISFNAEFKLKTSEKSPKIIMFC